jgi:hypothetical protein
MLRTTLAALAISAVLTSVSAAGDCATCGNGNGYGAGGYAANAWDGYCGCRGGGGGCGNACGGCNRCCFPLVHCTLHRIGRAFDALLPDPCCRRSCGSVGCAQPSCGQPTCGFEPGCGVVGPSDPFIDDHHVAPPQPTPAADARARSWGNARMMNYPQPKPVAKPRPMKTAAAAMPQGKAVARAGRSVLKVAYDEEASSSDEEYYEDAPPAAPASVRNAAQTPATLASAVRVTAKPVVSAKSTSPVNPLRP